VLQFFRNLILCLLPMLLTPIWGYLIADGYLNFGGGEKDLFLLIPWILWAFMYLLVFLITWIRRKTTKAMVLFSVGVATGIVTLTWLVLFIWFNNTIGVYKG
jgi:hypothetical protein